ncbi:uncharacterized protein TNCV_3288091 [Trichonephila clavipes]|nr:uncharacterized protein TNCV_3288091 [Trichonephila clavipes]
MPCLLRYDWSRPIIAESGPSRCQMADTFQNGPIQILLGANFLVNTVTGKPRKINKDLFMIPSLFGETDRSITLLSDSEEARSFFARGSKTT